MQKPQRIFKNGEQVAPRSARFVEIFGSDVRFQPFDIPVAEIAPEKVINHVRSFVEAEFLESGILLLDHAREARENPAVGKGIRSGVWRFRANLRRGELVKLQSCRFGLFEIEKQETGSIPDFVGKGAIAQNAFFAQRNV